MEPNKRDVDDDSKFKSPNKVTFKSRLKASLKSVQIEASSLMQDPLVYNRRTTPEKERRRKTDTATISTKWP
ncbi:hypothetical protein NECAME_15079 [Necator americanus]|uniref:Uncharacterized protein n=1 Tax=Necator americanus TaxID=51031 RepID=W2SJK9_NECAM|nr:hypothetical protein NECAME_15079 [Necator americanus]ETN69819.1 hypothetical protein NECAME_15079 [Necator americanus]